MNDPDVESFRGNVCAKTSSICNVNPLLWPSFSSPDIFRKTNQRCFDYSTVRNAANTFEQCITTTNNFL